MIRSDDLIALFQLMYAEKWKYEWGAARRGCVDCSGAFVYAFRQLGGSIYHGSNTIARKYVGAFQKTPAPGFAAFKWKKTDTAKYPDGRGDFYHIGLVDADGEFVLNAKGTKAGFCRDKADGWHSFAPLLGVEYNPSAPSGASPLIGETGDAEKPPLLGEGDRPQDGGEVHGEEKGESWSVTEYHARVKVKSGRLNMRSGPGTEHGIVERLPDGTPLVVIAEFDTDGDGKADWAFVDEDGVQGYVSTAYIERVPVDDAGAENPPPGFPEGGAAYAVFIPCENGDEARRYAGNIKNAVIVRYDREASPEGEKPPGDAGGEGE